MIDDLLECVVDVIGAISPKFLIVILIVVVIGVLIYFGVR